MMAAKKGNKEINRLERTQDILRDGQDEIKDNQKEICKGISRLQKTLDDINKGESGSSAEGVKESVSVQETGQEKKKQPPESKEEASTNTDQPRRNSTKLSAEEPLRKLWGKQGFRDEFCKEMNVKYNKTSSKHWPNLGEEFGIKRDKIDEFASFDAPSPSEALFRELERKKPYLKIKELCDALTRGKAEYVSRIVQNAIEGEKISLSDLISDMWDKDPETVKQIILNLDKKYIWRDVAIALGFKREDYQSFERDMDPASNLTRDLFDGLRTQQPRMKVKIFRQKLEKIEQKKVLKILKDHDTADHDELRDLSRKSDVMLDVERILNDPQDTSLWRLACEFEEDGLDIDVEMFRARGTDVNPTFHLMEHVLACSPKEPTINDLIVHLDNIGRKDICERIIAEYLEAVQEELPNDPTSNPSTSSAQANANQPLQETENLQGRTEKPPKATEQPEGD